MLCFGILLRVENPLGLLRALGGLLAPGGRLLVETYGSRSTVAPPMAGSRCTRPARWATNCYTWALAPVG